MPNTALGPRVLLRRLREVMAGKDTAQAKLDRVVSLIAANMVAEVCSLYVLREGGVLELYATEGLRPEAVRTTRLKVGEGLVGTIAEQSQPLNLPDARAHPSFKYMKETGEEIYSSFLGVPVQRADRTIGVLVVQNKTSRQYSDEEQEALSTTAMVLAELIASGELGEVAREVAGDVALERAHRITGEALGGGIALGHCVLHEPRVVITDPFARDIDEEEARLQVAIDVLREQIDALIEGNTLERRGEHIEILETVRMFAYDRGWIRRMREAVATGLTAEAAVERVQTDLRTRMSRQSDPYLRERMHDLDDLSYRLLRILSGQTATAAAGDLPRDSIIVARAMGPAELLDYNRDKVRGLVLSDSGATSHVAIVARALGLATVGRAQGVIDVVDTGTAIIVDGSAGEVHVRPPSDVEDAYREKVRLYARKQAQYAKLRDKPALTRDGVKVEVMINAGLLVDMPHLEQAGADGIGLYRTELQFMLARKFPRPGEQIEHYRTVLDAAGDRPVTFRSLDIGSDKMLPYFHSEREQNPALGWRALRIGLDRPALLKLQLRALLRAGSGRCLRIMFPMVCEAGEFTAARALVDKELEFIISRGHEPPAQLLVGAMIEVPSIIWQLEALLQAADFISIGSNDLLQYLFAADRTNARVANRYDPLSPAALRAMAMVADTARACGAPLSLCGEMASDPVAAMALVGIGITSISMTPAAVGPVKQMILSLDSAAISEFVRARLNGGERSLRGELEKFAADNGVNL